MSGTSGSLSPTVAAPPTATSVATNLLSLMAALNGQATDFNVGSEIRTYSEATGMSVEQQGVGNQALSVQALTYGAMSLFNIGQAQATAATGIVTFATSIPISGAPNAPQAIAIPSGTLVQTAGGVQFATTVATTLASGTSNISVGVVATSPGAAGHVNAGLITGSPLTALGYPLYVTNQADTAGGSNAGTPSQAVAQFTAAAAALGLSSPVAIANAMIGVIATGTGEIVAKAACYEPWLAAGSGAGSGTAGFTAFVDNGTGSASASLLAAVQAWITGSVAANQSGYRPAGVPFVVSGVTAVDAVVAVSGVLLPGLLTTGAVATSIASGVAAYFSGLSISQVDPVTGDQLGGAYQPQIAAVVGDAGLGGYLSLTVNLYYSGSGSPVPLVSGGVGTRVVLAALTSSLTIGGAT